MGDSLTVRTLLDPRGNLDMLTGGLTVTGLGRNSGGVSVMTQGLKVQSTLSIASGGLFTYDSGLTISSGGVNILGGGLRVTGGMSVRTQYIAGTPAGLLAGALVNGGVTVNTLGLQINTGGLGMYGGMSVIAGGVTVTGGMSIFAGGLWLNKKATLRVVDQGLIVNAGGVTINNGVLVPGLKGALHVTGGMTVHTGGLIIHNPGGLLEWDEVRCRCG